MQQTAQAFHNSLPRQSGFRFGLENTPVKKGFSASKMFRGRKKIIGRLHSKINTRFDKMGVKNIQ